MSQTPNPLQASYNHYTSTIKPAVDAKIQARDFEGAQAELETQLTTASAKHDPFLIGALLGQLSYVHYHRNHFAESLDAATSAIAMLQTLPPHQQQMLPAAIARSDANNMVAEAQERLGNAADAVAAHRQNLLFLRLAVTETPTLIPALESRQALVQSNLARMLCTAARELHNDGHDNEAEELLKEAEWHAEGTIDMRKKIDHKIQTTEPIDLAKKRNNDMHVATSYKNFGDVEALRASLELNPPRPDQDRHRMLTAATTYLHEAAEKRLEQYPPEEHPQGHFKRGEIEESLTYLAVAHANMPEAQSHAEKALAHFKTKDEGLEARAFVERLRANTGIVLTMNATRTTDELGLGGKGV